MKSARADRLAAEGEMGEGDEVSEGLIGHDKRCRSKRRRLAAYDRKRWRSWRAAYRPTPIPITLTMNAVKKEIQAPTVQPSQLPTDIPMRSRILFNSLQSVQLLTGRWTS